MNVNKKPASKYFNLINLAKKGLISTATATFYPEPSAQIIALCLLQTLFLGVAFRLQPMKRRYQRILCLVTESCQLIILLIVF